MPSFAGLESHQPGVDNPEYFQMIPEAGIAASSSGNCASPVGISLTTSESQKASPNGNVVATVSSSDSQCSLASAVNLNDNGSSLPTSHLSSNSTNENGEITPPLPPRSVHSPSSSNFNTFSFGSTSPVSSNIQSPRVPPRPSAPSPPSYLGEYIYADPSKVSSSLRRSSSTASNSNNGPSSPNFPSCSTVASSHFPSTSLSVVTAVHNALYHALDSSPAPPTLPLKGLTLIPPAVGPKSPHHSPSSPKTQFSQNVSMASSPMSPHRETRTRSASATEPPPIPAKPILSQSLSSPTQSGNFNHAGSSINFSQLPSASGCSESQSNLNASHSAAMNNTLMSQSFSSDVDSSQSLFDEKYDLSYCESQTLPRSGKLSSQVNGSESRHVAPGSADTTSVGGKFNVCSNVNGNSGGFNMSSSFHESSSSSFDGRRQLARCSLEDLRSSEMKKQEAVSARLAEEASHEAECQRLEEIVQICAEYQRQYSNSPPPPYEPPQSKAWPQSPSFSRSQVSPLQPSPTSTLTQNRIKTNGSLPRDKRSPPHPRLLQQSPELSSWGAQWEGNSPPPRDSVYVTPLPASANTNPEGARTVNSPDAPPKPPRSPRIERSVLGCRQPPVPPSTASAIQPQQWSKKTPPPIPPNKPCRRDITPDSVACSNISATPVSSPSSNFSTFTSSAHSLDTCAAYSASAPASARGGTPISATSSPLSSYPSSTNFSSANSTTASSHSYSFNYSSQTQFTNISSLNLGASAKTVQSSYGSTTCSDSNSANLIASSKYSGVTSSDVPSSASFSTVSEGLHSQSGAERTQFTSSSTSAASFTTSMSGDIERIKTNCTDSMAASEEPPKSDGAFSGHLYMNTKVSDASQYQNDLADQQTESETKMSQSNEDDIHRQRNEGSNKSGLGPFNQVDSDGSVPPSPSGASHAHVLSPSSTAGNFLTGPNFSFANSSNMGSYTAPSYVNSTAASSVEDCLTSTSGVTNCGSVSECEELLRAERNEALQYTTDLKRSVADLARQEEEAYRELEVERALLEAECGDVEREVERLESVLLQLNERSTAMEERHSGDREQDRLDLRVCLSRVEAAEGALERAESDLESVERDEHRDTDLETRLLETVKAHHETLDACKKVFEDMEFSQMEQEAQREAEREDLNRLMCKEKARLAQQEERLSQLRKQVEALNAAVQRETSKIDAHRSELNARLQTERHRAKTAEQKLLQLRGLVAVNTTATSPPCAPPVAHVASLHHTYANDPFANARQLSVSSDSEEEDPLPSESGDPNIHGSRLHLLCDAVSAMTQSVTSLTADNNKNKDGVSAGGGVEQAQCELRERRASFGEDRVPDSRLRREARDEKTRTLDDEAFAMTRKLALNDVHDGSQSVAEDLDSGRHREQNLDSLLRDRESLDCVENAFIDEEARRAAELEKKKQNLSGKFSLENIIEDSRRRNRANIEAAVGGSLGRSISPPAAEMGRQVSERYALSRAPTYRDEEASPPHGDDGLDDAISSRSLRVNSDEVDLSGEQQPRRAMQLSISDVILRDRESGAEDMRPLSESSSFCGATGEDTPPSVCYRPRHSGRPKQQRPLTRYLPVKSTEPSSLQFDLKQHIESAGHQIDMCPSIRLTATSCRGYLLKLSGSSKHKMTDGRTSVMPHHSSKNSGRLFGMKGYNKRWFVFDRMERALIYYSDKSENKAKGFIYFEDIEEVYVDHANPHTVNGAKKSSKDCPSVAFCVKARSRTLSLLAPSAATMRIWVEVIFTGAEGYHTYDEY